MRHCNVGSPGSPIPGCRLGANVHQTPAVFVPKTDADGNGIAGIRLPDVDVPLATYTGWGLRAFAAAGNDGCDAAGQKIDFAQTRAQRLLLQENVDQIIQAADKSSVLK